MMKIQQHLPVGRLWDRLISKVHCLRRLHYWPNELHPKTFNEFFLREKLNSSANWDLSRSLTDKIEFKAWMREHGYGKYVVDTLAIFDDPGELLAYTSHHDAILKSSHGSGGAIVLKGDSSRLTPEQYREVSEWFQEDYYLRSREPNYRGLKPRAILEPLLSDSHGNVPADFKIFCVYGTVVAVQVDLNRFENHTRQLYDKEWNLLPYCMAYPRNSTPLRRPSGLSEMVDVSARLGKRIRLCRLDFYQLADGSIRIGEVTFFPGNCAEKFEPHTGDRAMGALIGKELNRDSSNPPKMLSTPLKLRQR